MISDALRALVDGQVTSLRKARFILDPLFPTHSLRRQLESSAIKRHGGLIEVAIVEALAREKDYLLWKEARFFIPAAADHAVQSQKPEEIAATRLPYGAGGRSLQIDLLAFSRSRRRLGAYEIKRGLGRHDSSKLRSMRRDVYAVQTVLASYGSGQGQEIKDAISRVIFYYGARSLPSAWSLTGAELDEHFGCRIRSHVEEMTDYFRLHLEQCIDERENRRFAQFGLVLSSRSRSEVAVSEEQFFSRWTLDDLLRVDPDLHEALLDQQSMLNEAEDEEDIALNEAAMRRGWQAALKRMEDEEIARAGAVFPDAAVRIREK